MGEIKLTYKEVKAKARKTYQGQNPENARLQRIYHKIMNATDSEQYEVRE